MARCGPGELRVVANPFVKTTCPIVFSEVLCPLSGAEWFLAGSKNRNCGLAIPQLRWRELVTLRAECSRW